MDESSRVVSACRQISAPAATIFELIANPARQPEWDGNDNLSHAVGGRRITGAGQVFSMTLTTNGAVRENHVVEFAEGSLIAWRPAEPGGDPIGHLWRWELEPNGTGTRVTHTYDWTDLDDPSRLPRARATTAERLGASLDRLAELAESADSAS